MDSLEDRLTQLPPTGTISRARRAILTGVAIIHIGGHELDLSDPATGSSSRSSASRRI